MVRLPVTTASLFACVLLLSFSPQTPAAAPPTPSCVRCGETDVRVERFFPKQKGQRPAVILLHGLEGMQKNGKFYRTAAEYLNAKGYAVVIVHYLDRTATKEADLPGLVKSFRAYLDDPKRWREADATFALWLEAVEAALVDVHSHPRVDPKRVALVGFSLGGFLATSAASRCRRVACVASVFGGLPRPLANQADSMPPALLIHGDADDVVPLRECHRLRDLLMERKRVCKVKVYKGAGHCFVGRDGKPDLLAALDAQTLALAFLDRHLNQDRTK